MADVVPEAGRVADRRRVVDERAVELLFDPGGRAVHDVDVDAGRRVDPFVARLPKLVADFDGDAEPFGDGAAIGERDRIG